jgi:hypothetical protein
LATSRLLLAARPLRSLLGLRGLRRRFVPGIRSQLSPKAPSAPTLSLCACAFRHRPGSTAFEAPTNGWHFRTLHRAAVDSRPATPAAKSEVLEGRSQRLVGLTRCDRRVGKSDFVEISLTLRCRDAAEHRRASPAVAAPPTAARLHRLHTQGPHSWSFFFCGYASPLTCAFPLHSRASWNASALPWLSCIMRSISFSQGAPNGTQTMCSRPHRWGRSVCHKVARSFPSPSQGERPCLSVVAFNVFNVR